MPDPLGLFGEQVHGFGRSVGAAAGDVEGENLGLPGSYGASQAGQLGDPDAIAPAVEALQRDPGLGQVAGGIDRAQQFLALPGGYHLATRVTGGQPRPQPRPSSAGELLGGGQQQLAVAVQRIWLAASMPQGGLLGPPADLVDHRVGQLDGVEVVHHHPGVAKRCHQRAGVAAPGVQATVPMPASQSWVRACSQPPTAALVRSATTSSRRPRSRSTRPVTQRVGARRVALRKPVSSSPSLPDPVQARRGHPPAGCRAQPPPAWWSPSRPQVAGDRRHRVGVLADPPTRLGAGPFGQHRPRPDGGRLLGPGPDLAGRLPTAPEALAPPQHHRPAADRQVAHPDRASAVRGGRHATTPTADHRGRGLDGKLPFATHELGRDELEAVQAQQRRPRRTTVLTHLGPPSCRHHASASYARSQVLF